MRKILLLLLVIGLAAVICTGAAGAEDLGTSTGDGDNSPTNTTTVPTTEATTADPTNTTTVPTTEATTAAPTNTTTVPTTDATTASTTAPTSAATTQATSAAVLSPSVSISAETTPGSLTVTFSRTVTNSPDTYLWEFGDDLTSSSSSETVTHTYSKADTYTVKLKVSNSAGSDSATKSITVTDSDSVVTLETNVTSGKAPLSVRFKAVTDLSVTSSTGFRWDVHPDETYKYGQTLDYTYEKEGTYTVTLRVTPDSGSTIDKTVTIKVGESSGSDELSAVFSSSTTKDTVPFTVTFTDKSTGNISEWKWTFGDDTRTFTSKTNPTYTFTTAGNYRVKLVVTDTDSKTSETYATIIAMEKSTATPTATAKALTSAAAETTAAEADLVPNPLDIVDEFLRLLLAMLNPANYALNI